MLSPVPGPAPTHWEACVDPQQGVDVFPSDDENLCQTLGLQPVPPSYYEAAHQYSGLEEDLFARFSDTSCITELRGAIVARQVLDAHGYAGWTIQSHGFGEQTPCASIDLDPVNGTATLRGVIRPGLSSAVQQGLHQANSCGPEDVLLADVRQALAAAGFRDWTVRIDHQLTAKWPCVAGFNADPGLKTIILSGYSTG